MILNLPNENISKEKKDSYEFGTEVAKAIASGEYYDFRQQRFHENETLANGLQDPNYYKKLAGSYEGDNDFQNLFWQVVNPLPKYITNAVDILTQNKYKPVATATDPISTLQKEGKKAELLGNMMLREAEKDILKDTGVKMTNKSDVVPNSVEEYQIHEQLNLKSSLEVANELGASVILKNNDYEKSVRRLNAKSLSVNKWAGIEVSHDENGDIRINRIPENRLILPYSEDEFFKDTKYKGYIRLMPISELRSHDQNSLTDSDLYDLAQISSGEFGNPAWNHSYNQNNHNEVWNNFLVQVLSFEFNTTISWDYVSFERKKGGKMFKENDGTDKYKSDKYDKISKKRQVYYDGLYVLGTDKIMKWDLRDNAAFNGDGLYDSRPMSRFIIAAPDIYQMRNKSLVEASEPHLHMIQRASLKMQELMSKVTPPKTAIDLDGQENVWEGLGFKGGSPMDLQKITEQLGLIYFRGSQISGAGGQRPVYEIPSSIRYDIQSIAEIIDRAYKSLEDEIGLSDVLMGSNTDQYEGKASRQMKVSSSIRSLSNLQNALDYMGDQTIKVVSSMLNQALCSDNYKFIRGLEKAIGKTNIEILKISKYEHLGEIGIDFKMMPTELEMQELSVDLQRALENDSIRIEDAQLVRRYAKENPKLATTFMTLKRREYMQERMAEAQNAAQANSEQQQQSAQVAAEMQRQQKIMDFDMKSKLAEMQSQLNIVRDGENNMSDMDKIALKEEYRLEQIDKANDNKLNQTTSSNEARQPSVYPSA